MGRFRPSVARVRALWTSYGPEVFVIGCTTSTLARDFFPEIPCSYNTDNFVDYRECVEGALNELVNAGVIRPAERARFYQVHCEHFMQHIGEVANANNNQLNNNETKHDSSIYTRLH